MSFLVKFGVLSCFRFWGTCYPHLSTSGHFQRTGEIMGTSEKIRQVEPTFCKGKGRLLLLSEALWGKLHDLHEGRVLRELPESLALKLVWILDLSWPVRPVL